MEVKVVISPELAILAGSSRAGTIPVKLTDEFIAELNEEEREMLIVLVEHSTDWSLYNQNGSSVAHDRMARADLPSLKAYIKHRVAAVAEANAKLDADEVRQRAEKERVNEERIRAWMAKPPSENLSAYQPTRVVLPTLHDAPICVALSLEYSAHRAQLQELAEKRDADLKQREADLQREYAERDDANKTNICDWIRDHGSESQQARALEGLLPEKELLGAVRDWLFAPLDGFARYERLDDGDARHAEGCYTGAPISYKTADADELTAAEFERLKALREVAKTLAEPAEVQAREHRVWCKRGECPDMTLRRSVLVKIDWNGHALSREYALTAPGEDSYAD